MDAPFSPDYWGIDMDAWNLTEEQRRHHMCRVRQYHSAQAKYWAAEAERCAALSVRWLHVSITGQAVAAVLWLGLALGWW